MVGVWREYERITKIWVTWYRPASRERLHAPAPKATDLHLSALISSSPFSFSSCCLSSIWLAEYSLCFPCPAYSLSDPLPVSSRPPSSSCCAFVSPRKWRPDWYASGLYGCLAKPFSWAPFCLKLQSAFAFYFRFFSIAWWGRSLPAWEFVRSLAFPWWSNWTSISLAWQCRSPLRIYEISCALSPQRSMIQDTPFWSCEGYPYRRLVSPDEESAQ